MSADVISSNDLSVPEETPLRHSGLGITSFVIGLVFGVLLVACILLSGYGYLNDDEVLKGAAGVLMLVSIIETVHGLLFGVAGLYFWGRKRLFAWLGIATNGLALVFSLTVLAIGVYQS